MLLITKKICKKCSICFFNTEPKETCVTHKKHKCEICGFVSCCYELNMTDQPPKKHKHTYYEDEYDDVNYHKPKGIVAS